MICDNALATQLSPLDGSEGSTCVAFAKVYASCGCFVVLEQGMGRDPTCPACVRRAALDLEGLCVPIRLPYLYKDKCEMHR